MNNNLIIIDGVKAAITNDPQTGLIRGEFMGLNGGADFYAENLTMLEIEGRKSLKVFLDMCKAKSIDPFKKFSLE